MIQLLVRTVLHITSTTTSQLYAFPEENSVTVPAVIILTASTPSSCTISPFLRRTQTSPTKSRSVDMETALTSAAHKLSLSRNSSRSFNSLNAKITPISSFSFANFALSNQLSLGRSLVSRQNCLIKVRAEADGAINVDGVQSDDFILEDVPHLTDFLPDLPVILRFIKSQRLL